MVSRLRVPIENIIIANIGVSLITYMLAGQLPLLKGQHGKTGRNVLQPKVKIH